MILSLPVVVEFKLHLGYVRSVEVVVVQCVIALSLAVNSVIVHCAFTATPLVKSCNGLAHYVALNKVRVLTLNIFYFHLLILYLVVAIIPNVVVSVTPHTLLPQS